MFGQPLDGDICTLSMRVCALILIVGSAPFDLIASFVVVAFYVVCAQVLGTFMSDRATKGLTLSSVVYMKS